jgi:beta-lactamase class A
MLQEKLQAVMDAFPARSALYCVDLTTGEPIAAIGEDTKVVSASTIKVMILCCALQDVMDGKLNLDLILPITEDNFCDDTRVFVPEYRTDGATLWEHLYWMIVSSDNTATNTVISLLGYDHINAYCASIGLTESQVQRKMLDWSAIEAGRNNYTSPRDQYRIYKMLYAGEILNEELRTVATDFLSRNRNFGGLLRYIPDPVTVWRKAGGLDYLDHDAGIFLLDGNPYFLGIFTWDGPALDGEDHQQKLIGQLSRMVYDYMK